MHADGYVISLSQTARGTCRRLQAKFCGATAILCLTPPLVGVSGLRTAIGDVGAVGRFYATPLRPLAGLFESSVSRLGSASRRRMDSSSASGPGTRTTNQRV